MAGHPGWYPPGQICYPAELPGYLKNVYDLKPVIGLPSDAEVMGVHSVIHAAHKVTGVPGMHDADLFMRLADHLFGVQMAKYRSKYSLITFPSDAMYTPPALPVHVTITLEPVLGAPSDEEVVRVQEAVRAYQHFSSVTSMFDPLVNMKLSQHLFDIQMARYMRAAGEFLPNPAAQVMERREIPTQTMDPVIVDESIVAMNNAGTGANAAEVYQTSQIPAGVDIRGLMERSNQLTERLSKLLERSNELTERCTQPADQSHSQTLAERFNQVLEQFTRILEPTRRPAEPDQLAERFNQLLHRFNLLSERANQPLQTANELSERANQIAERSNQLAEQAQKPVERLGDVLRNVNKVLVAIQHAIIRSHKGNTTSAVDCLINDKGETPSVCPTTQYANFGFFARYYTSSKERLPVIINGVPQTLYVPDSSIGAFLDFYGLNENHYIRKEGTHAIRGGAEIPARIRLGDYLSSQLG